MNRLEELQTTKIVMAPLPTKLPPNHAQYIPASKKRTKEVKPKGSEEKAWAQVTLTGWKG